MSVSAVSNAPVSLGFRPQAAPQAETHEVRKSDDAREDHGHRHDRVEGRSVKPRALNVFDQELKVAFESKFRAKFAVTQPAYAQLQGESDSDDIARDALSAARQLVSEAPTESAKALITFRATVREAASYVRQTLGEQDDIPEIDDALARVNEGLDELETEVAKNQVSSATALEVDVRSKQRTSIKIRTQEGDVVKLSIKHSDRLSASDTSTTEGGKTSSTTEIEVSSRSRLKLTVEGDLNDEELAAIRNVFAQAEEIADQFFGGDLSAAFDLASGFEFDADQLARVKLKFRSYQSTSVAYTETNRPTLSAAAVSSPQVTAAATPSAPSAGNDDIRLLPPADRPIVTNRPLVDPQVTAGVDAEVVETVSPPTQSLVDLSSFTELFEQISDFLRSVGSGFEAGSASGSDSVRFHYSESFKLTLLLAVVNEVAPEESENAAATVSSVIGTIADRSGLDIDAA